METYSKPQEQRLGRPPTVGEAMCGKHLSAAIDFARPRGYSYVQLCLFLRESYGVSDVAQLTRTQALEVLKMIKRGASAIGPRA